MIRLINASDLEANKYGKALFDYISTHIKHDDKWIKLPTNSRLGDSLKEVAAFNNVLAQLRMQGDTHIFINLNR